MKKVNIAELLKDCPKGMELDSPMFENLEFDRIDKDNSAYSIICRVKTEWGHYNIHTFTEYGCYSAEKYSKCVIFPKGKTTWEGFHRPFKDGDILYCNANDDGEDKDMFKYIFIFDKIVDGRFYYSHCHLFGSEFYDTKANLVHDYPVRFATEEEKQRLFDAIKANGYRWDAETKTLEKLVTIFKVGDKIKLKNAYAKKYNDFNTREITEIQHSHYILDDKQAMPLSNQYLYELVPNKFDINTLKPFDKVLVRNDNSCVWKCNLYSHYSDYPYHYICMDTGYKQCIPYKDNEHLLGKVDDCDEYFKIWEH